ncbi:phospholipase D-like domain-containing protein [Nosocomiicoccus ampullae]|uniref:phospholipase D-like domain-containing protein n=1 Tax=Nosocomiicoccus ampullae TaxID=489910 RepID=UPI001C5E769C|nr:phospholipase D-like domain-containing protein [Nosocomiicoccus ampullae]QYA48649.1 hypothetical protein KPF52_00945 [Nosocomiicoccus ampullae]
MAKKSYRKRRTVQLSIGIVLILIIIPIFVGVYSLFKPLPEGISVQSDFRKTDDLDILYDVTYEDKNKAVHHDQEIVDTMYEVIDNAEEFIVLDMFLFNNDYNHDTLEFPTLSDNFADRLVQKKQESDIPITVITDPINSFYGTYDTKVYKKLRDAGIDVIETNLSQLRDSNYLYSGYYRTYLTWIKPGGLKILPNALRPMDDKVGIGSYLRLLNFKANHRKTIMSEKEGVITSLNPHDGSSLHSNIAVRFAGDTLNDLLKSEIAVLDFSGYDTSKIKKYEIETDNNTGEYEISLVTESKIRGALIDTVNTSEAGDSLKIGVFYLSDRGFIKALKKALDRDVKVQLILDINQDAFGNEKNGIPNKPVASELMNYKNPPEIRWYKSHGEQYHAKFMLYNNGEKSTLILGSSNFTRRNLKDLNLETDLIVKANSDSEEMIAMNEYYNRLWNNEDDIYTLDYEEEREDSVMKTILYRIQEGLGLSTF